MLRSAGSEELMTLLGELRGWQNLPNYVDRDDALRGLISEWKGDAFVSQVLAEKNSFSGTLFFVLAHNRAIKFPYFVGEACRSKVYLDAAKAVREQLGELIPLTRFYQENYAGGGSTVDVTKPVFFPRIFFVLMSLLITFMALLLHVMIWPGGEWTHLIDLFIGLALSYLLMLYICSQEVWYRKLFADELEKNARFIDKTLKSVSSN